MEAFKAVLGPLQTNCYVAFSNGCAVIIDLAVYSKQLLDAVRREGLKVSAIVLTHAHSDHVLGAPRFKEELGCPILIGRQDAGDLGSALASPLANQEAIPFQADRLLCDGDAIAVGDEFLTVMETPGHTRGSVCLLAPGALFSGDTLFCEGIGRTDFEGGSERDIVQSIQRLFREVGDSVPVYPGHGEATTIGHEKSYNPYVRG
ncbi:MAG: MBL fold metallo-hydrolase [Eubacteriaceae bacterium]|jgi:glyoxylase-like metal-dependent hydrolase (beta-lactamase superfamily II)|nr:MBL fold metallo-hydrolase [Eubacteriaceae bacterium]